MGATNGRREAQERAVAEKLKLLAAKVPAVRADLAPGELSAQDRVLRAHAAAKLEELQEAVAALRSALVDNMLLWLLGEADRLAARAARLTQRDRESDNSACVVADGESHHPDLYALYDADLAILARIDSLVNSCDLACRAEAIAEESAKAAMASLRIEMSELEDLFECRDNAARRLGL
jgi:hypothetical protein